MTVPITLASLTVMLWLVWSDSVRPRRSSRILYAVRVALYLIVGGILAVRLIRTPFLFTPGGRYLAYLTVFVALAGATYFVRRAAAVER